MSFADTFVEVFNGLTNAIRDGEQAALMTAARAEPNAIVRQQKIQMVLQLPTVGNSFVRGQMVTEILHRSE